MSDKFLQTNLIANFTGGKNSIFESDEIDITEARQCINANLGRKLGIQPREGSTCDGAFSTTNNPIKNAHTFTTKNGLERPIRNSGTILEYRNPYISTPDWLTLDTGYTTGKIFGFVDGDTVCYMANGVETLRRWTGAVARFDLATSTSNVIGLKSETDGELTLNTAALLGFTTSGSVIINGNTYTYTGISGLTLTGVNTTPVGEADGAGVAEKPISTGFTSAPYGNILLIFNQRLLVSGDPTNPNIIYGSKIANAYDFSFSSPAVADDGFVVKFWGKPITALGSKGDYVAVMKEDGGKKLSFTKIGNPAASSTSVLTVPVLDDLFEGNGQGAVNQKSTVPLDYDFLFVSRQLGLRRISRADGNDVDKPESMTEKIEDDFIDYDLTDVCAGAYKQQVHLGLRSNSDLSGNNLVIIKDTRNNFIGTYNGINASCFYIFNNKLYSGDSFTKNCWQLYNGEYADYDGTDYFDYTFRWRSKFFHYDYPENFKQIGFIWLEGYILPSTEAKFRLNTLSEVGLTTIEVPINGTDSYVQKTNISAMGNKKLGDIALTAGIESDLPSGTRRFFRMITPEKFDLLQHHWLKIQYELETNKAGSFIRLTKIRPFIYLLPIDQTKTNNILTS
jgi:hypothetical protein